MVYLIISSFDTFQFKHTAVDLGMEECHDSIDAPRQNAKSDQLYLKYSVADISMSILSLWFWCRNSHTINITIVLS